MNCGVPKELIFQGTKVILTYFVRQEEILTLNNISAENYA